VIATEIGISQQRAEQALPRFDPPTVAKVAEAVYPLQSVVSGTVVVEVSLGDTGKIADVRVVRGIPALTEPAERSVRQWKFQPAKLDGKAVASKVPWLFLSFHQTLDRVSKLALKNA
jgi:TonB family protein